MSAFMRSSITNLRDVVGARAELVCLEAVVDAVEHLLVEVGAGVDAPQVAHKVIPLHPPVHSNDNQNGNVVRVQVQTG